MSTLRPIVIQKPSTARPPLLSFQHTVRVSAIEPERIWKLNGDTLWMGTEGQPDIPIPLNNISKVRLAYEPSRFQHKRFRCYLYNYSTKVATIQNDHYKGIASFEDRSESYNDLLRILIPRIASLSPNAKFLTGTSYFIWFGNLLFIIVTFSFLILAMSLMFSAITGLIILKLVFIAFFIPTLFLWFKRNKPSKFDPSSIPISLLPNI